MPKSAEKCQKGGISKYRCYYPHMPRESVSSVCGIFLLQIQLLRKWVLEHVKFSLWIFCLHLELRCEIKQGYCDTIFKQPVFFWCHNEKLFSSYCKHLIVNHHVINMELSIFFLLTSLFCLFCQSFLFVVSALITNKFTYRNVQRNLCNAQSTL